MGLAGFAEVVVDVTTGEDTVVAIGEDMGVE
jgi:hypothetical protein